MFIKTALKPSVVFLLLIVWLISGDPVDAQSEGVKTFSLSCRSANLRSVLAQLAIQKGINITGLDSLDNGLTVTTHLNAVPFDEGLKALLKPKGFTFEKRNEIYFIIKSPPAHPRLSLNISDTLLSIDASGTDVNQVIRALAQAGISITSEQNLTGTITAHLIDQPIQKALPMLFADFTLHETDGIYRITERAISVQGSSTILIQGGRISLSAHNTSLTELMSEVAERLNINLSVIGEIDRPVSLRIKNKPLDELLEALAQMTGHSYHTVDDLHFFGKAELNQEEINPLIQRKTIWLKHLQAKEVLNLLPADIPKQNVTISEAHNTVTVAGTGELIASTKQFLLELDIDSDAIRSRQPKGTIAIAVDEQTQLLTVDLKNAPLFDVIRQLSIHTAVDVVFLGVDGIVQTSSASLPKESATTPKQATKAHSVTLRLTQATLEKVLNALFIGSRYAYRWTAANGDQQPMLIVGEGGHEPFASSVLHSLSYLDVVAVMELLPQPKDVIITPLDFLNALLLTGSREQIAQYKAKIAAMDRPQPQAMIKLYLLELTKGTRDELGLSIEGMDNRTTFTVDDGSSFNFDSLNRVPKAFGAKLSALVKQNKGKVLANPSLAVVNGRQAKIEIGGRHLFETNNPIYPTIGSTFNPGQEATGGITTYSSYPPSTYRSHFTIETGLMLELTPSIGASGQVSMDIQLAIRDADSLSREASSLSQRLITTNISVPNQGTVVIGGLLQEKKKEQLSQVPLLWRIPLIGKYLFTSKQTTIEQTELVVIIQPTVLK